LDFEPEIRQHLANGADITPTGIEPELIAADDPYWFDVFKWVRLVWWSLPYSAGFGRRLRFVVVDRSNDKLMGLIGLQSPPIDLAARDRGLGYPEERKTEIINQSMDIYTLGGVPPYNQLLSGKLAAMLAASNEVREAYARKYKDSVTQIAGRVLPARLLFLTTLSAFGRSSMYSRLRGPDGEPIAKPIGYTVGHGTFQFPDDLYERLREFLRNSEVDTTSGYGTGPRRRMQLIDAALPRLGLPRRLLRHGVRREVFLFPLVDHLKQVVARGTKGPVAWRDYPASELASFWLERWAIPRSERKPEWRDFDAGHYWSRKLREIRGL